MNIRSKDEKGKQWLSAGTRSSYPMYWDLEALRGGKDLANTPA